MDFLQLSLLTLAAVIVLTWDRVRITTTQPSRYVGRRLALIPSPVYSSVSPFGSAPNLAVTNGNPLKGFLTSPVYGPIPTDRVDPSLDFYYMSVSDVMKGYDSFDWTVPDQTIADARKVNRHVIWRFVVDYPRNLTGQTRRPSDVPQYLIDEGLKMYTRPPKSGAAFSQYPDYTDWRLSEGLRKFVQKLAEKYNGNFDVAYIQLGLIGNWGEWHTAFDNALPLIPEEMRAALVTAFRTYFSQTKLQTRYERKDAFDNGIGIHDDQFALSTLGGNNALWSKITAMGNEKFWRAAPMGGETDPILNVSTFSGNFSVYVTTTHPTYINSNMVFKNNLTDTQLRTVQGEHVRMGYNFFVPKVSAAFSPRDDQIILIATIRQVGLAPFYYPLRLDLTCNGASLGSLAGVDSIKDMGSEKDFAFRGVKTTCLNDLSLALTSPYLKPGRPIKFAQSDGKAAFKLPAPVLTNEGQIFIDAQSEPETGGRFNILGSEGVYSIEETLISDASWDPETLRYHRDFFRFHRWGAGLAYVIKLFGPTSFHYITLGFAETFFCENGKRVFNVLVNNIVVINALDVHARAKGCKKPFVFHTPAIQADSKGEIAIQFQAIAGKSNPMVSFILVS
jgi:Malectin domain